MKIAIVIFSFIMLGLGSYFEQQLKDKDGK
jgi:hypothetical protein